MPLQSTSGAATYDAFGVSAVSAVAQAEAIDYDGSNDYLQRTSDLVGNTNGKSFTFSVWVWPGRSSSAEDIYNSATGSGGFRIRCLGGTNWSVYAYNSGGTEVLACDFTTPVPSMNTFVNLLVSVDLASTANRYVYVNDVAASPSWSIYTNANINRTTTTHEIAAFSGGGVYYRGRLSNVFLDYTYRDLSVEANRRLFITANLKPAAGQAALSPIMYLSMSDPTAPGLNTGTGGNFTLNGVVARSGRGPNQYNAPYSDFDGSVDYLSRTTAPTGIADSKTFTFHCVFNTDDVTNGHFILWFGTGSLQRLYIQLNNGVARLGLNARNASNTQILNALSDNNTIVVGRNYVLDVSIDMANAANRHVFLNGSALPMSWTTYTDDNIQFNISSTPSYNICGSNLPSDLHNGRLGALWFNTNYIDLSVPANLAKFVSGTGINAAPVDLGATGQLPTGTSPLVYLPMYGNNAGRNYGTGGDFTVNSGPYTGARGPNEFWGNRALSAGGWLSRASSIGISDGKIFSFSMYFQRTSSGSTTVFLITDNQGGSGAPRLQIQLESGADPSAIAVRAWDSSGTNVLNVRQGGIVNFGTTYHFCGYIDLANTSNRGLYLNGSLMSPTWTTYTDAIIDLNPATPRYWIGGEYSSPSADWTGVNFAELYFTTTYIDFSQEANRLKFRDAFGNPVNLTQQIEALAIPNPAIYMRFPPTSFGTNSGTGGAFTVNGTITDGGQL